MADKPTAVITGASRGIGRSIALNLASNGKYKLCLLARDEKLLKETKKLCQCLNETVIAKCYAVDMADTDKLRSTLTDICTNFGPLHALINNAGIGGSGDPYKADLNHWDKMLDVNLRSITHSIATCLPYLKKSALSADNVSIINISSVAGTLRIAGAPQTSMYAATKFGLNGFSEALFSDVREDGIKVVTIMPGYVETDMVKKLKKSHLLEFGNMMRPSDVAQSVQYALDCSRYCCPKQILLFPQRSCYKAKL